MSETRQGGTRRRAGGGRDRHQSARVQAPRQPYIQRKIGTFNVLGEEGLSLIERNADEILKETGMEFRGDPEILDIFRDAGADVQGERVRFEPGMCRSIIQATAPRQYEQHARNAGNNVIVGGDNTVLCPVFGPPFVHNLDDGRRYATIEDFRNLVKIHHMIPEYHHSGGVVCEPVDLPANKRHLDMLYSHFKYSDRAIFGALIGAERAQDSVNMAKIVFGDFDSGLVSLVVDEEIFHHGFLEFPRCLVDVADSVPHRGTDRRRVVLEVEFLKEELPCGDGLLVIAQKQAALHILEVAADGEFVDEAQKAEQVPSRLSDHVESSHTVDPCPVCGADDPEPPHERDGIPRAQEVVCRS